MTTMANLVDPDSSGRWDLRDGWARASSLSSEGLLHEAVLEFLRLRVLLEEEQSWLRREPEQPSGHGFSTVPSSGRLPKGGTHAAELVASVGAAETVEVSPIPRKACGLVNNLLHEVDQELGAHLKFLANNHYAALQLPSPSKVGRIRRHCALITDRTVKSNYRQLALRFHPDKTGAVDSSSLFTTVQTAFENLATAKQRALYNPPPPHAPSPRCPPGDEFSWAVMTAGGHTKQSCSLACSRDTPQRPCLPHRTGQQDGVGLRREEGAGRHGAEPSSRVDDARRGEAKGDQRAPKLLSRNNFRTSTPTGRGGTRQTAGGAFPISADGDVTRCHQLPRGGSTTVFCTREVPPLPACVGRNCSYRYTARGETSAQNKSPPGMLKGLQEEVGVAPPPPPPTSEAPRYFPPSPSRSSFFTKEGLSGTIQLAPPAGIFPAGIDATVRCISTPRTRELERREIEFTDSQKEGCRVRSGSVRDSVGVPTSTIFQGRNGEVSKAEGGTNPSVCYELVIVTPVVEGGGVAAATLPEGEGSSVGAPTRNDFDERRDGLYRIASRENLEGIGVDAVGSSSGSGKGDITGERSDPDPCDVAKYCASQIVGLDEESTTSNMSSDCSGDCGMHGIDNYMMDSGEELGDGTWPDGGGVRRGGGRCVRRLRERIASSGHSHPSIVCPCPMFAHQLQEEVDFWISGAQQGGVRSVDTTIPTASYIPTASTPVCSPSVVPSPPASARRSSDSGADASRRSHSRSSSSKAAKGRTKRGSNSNGNVSETVDGGEPEMHGLVVVDNPALSRFAEKKGRPRRAEFLTDDNSLRIPPEGGNRGDWPEPSGSPRGATSICTDWSDGSGVALKNASAERRPRTSPIPPHVDAAVARIEAGFAMRREPLVVGDPFVAGGTGGGWFWGAPRDF